MVAEELSQLIFVPVVISLGLTPRIIRPASKAMDSRVSCISWRSMSAILFASSLYKQILFDGSKGRCCSMIARSRLLGCLWLYEAFKIRFVSDGGAVGYATPICAFWHCARR